MDGPGQQRETIAPDGRQPIGAHSLVRLVRSFEGPDGHIPCGTIATVLEVFEAGAAYLVEFEGPYDVPETVAGALLEVYDGPA